MADEKLLTVREVSLILDISEKEVLDLSESGKLPAYKVGGVYLRFKRDQVMEFKKTHKPVSVKADSSSQYKFKDKIRDFFYFNDFYIMAVLVITLLLLVILRGY
jgi:excisionase family DNA binding protein